MQKDSMMPAMPTTQVRRRKRMTPKMFCRQGRYTPMKVPIRGACGQAHSVRPCRQPGQPFPDTGAGSRAVAGEDGGAGQRPQKGVRAAEPGGGS